MTRAEFDAIADDTARGRLSGIPSCCIRFFIEQWLPLCRDPTRAAVRRAYMRAIRWERWGYVPCPDCFCANRRVRVVHHGD